MANVAHKLEFINLILKIMDYRSKLASAIIEMTDNEIEDLYKYIPLRFKASEKQKQCNHNIKYDMKTGGSTCTKCHWMS